MYHYSLVDLLLFSAVAEESCLTRGARKAHLSLPSASLRMKSLEEALHVTLFNRKPRGIELTPAGEILNQHVNEIKQTLARMENEIAPYARLRSGVIRIAANYGSQSISRRSSKRILAYRRILNRRHRLKSWKRSPVGVLTSA